MLAHGVVMIAIPIALLSFLDMSGGRALTQTLLFIAVVGLALLVVGWRKFNGQDGSAANEPQSAQSNGPSDNAGAGDEQ